MKSITSLTAIVLTKNSEETIGDCLKSLSWIDTIIVVDEESVDKTVQVAKGYKAKIIKHSHKSFSKKREMALKQVMTPWLFYVDSDERVSEKLKREIIKVVSEKKYMAFDMPRENVLLGKKMRWGGWWPDYVLRLMKKENLKGYKGKLHEQPVIEGEVGRLTNPLTHISHVNLTEMVAKTNEWSEVEAKLMLEAGHPPMNLIRFITAMFREFWYRAVRRLGFLDGAVGVIEIIYQVFSRFISYAKLWEMQRKSYLSKGS